MKARAEAAQEKAKMDEERLVEDAASAEPAEMTEAMVETPAATEPATSVAEPVPATAAADPATAAADPTKAATGTATAEVVGAGLMAPLPAAAGAAAAASAGISASTPASPAAPPGGKKEKRKPNLSDDEKLAALREVVRQAEEAMGEGEDHSFKRWKVCSRLCVCVRIFFFTRFLGEIDGRA